MFSAADGHQADDDPLRLELLSLHQLEQHAQGLAEQHSVAKGCRVDKLLPRLAENERVLRQSYGIVTVALAEGRRMTSAAEWLLDNFYLVEQQIHQARLHLPRAYSRKLPCLTTGAMAGFPRVYHMAIDLISHLDGKLDAETTMGFVAAYQQIVPLALGELWAFPIALRLGLIENLRRVAVRIARRRREQDAGVAWAERMLRTAESEPKALIHLLADFAEAQPSLSAPFLEEFCGRIRGRGAAMAFVLNWVEHALLEEDTTEARLLHADSCAQAAEQVSIANSIGSLRFLDAMEWKEFVETLSVVDQALRCDPVSAFAAQDFATRDRYRHVVERLAERSGKTEAAVATAAVDLATAAANQAGGRVGEAHVGHYLLGAGRPLLERALGCRWTWPNLPRMLSARAVLWLYLGAIMAATGAVVTTILPWLADGATNPWFWALALAAIVAASSLAVPLVNLLVTLLVPPRPLPRMDFAEAIPSDHRTMVVIPCLLTDGAEIVKLLEDIEIRHLGNRDSNLFFGLLTDFTDADQATMPDDAAQLRQVSDGIGALNDRHRRDGATSTPFYLFHRPRTWNRSERCWMGYERKRGKIEQFNDLLRGPSASDGLAMVAGDPSVLPTIKYVITLDADTELPRGAAHRLVGAMAHPLNRPRFDPDVGRVVTGYAILQPRTSIRLAAAGQSRFSSLFAGETGIDPYTREISDVYQDLFGEGTYVGKGIYDVDAFRQALSGRFPENLVLSHDLLESGYARSALLSDLELIEECPASYLGEASRQHRWIRGDWQIIRWLLPWPPTGTMPRRRNPLTALSRWKIFDNVRRSLFAPALMFWLVAGWMLASTSPWACSLYAVTILFLVGILRSLANSLRKPADCGWRLHLRLATRRAGRDLVAPWLTLWLLPYETWIAMDAIRHSALRMPFTRRGLMIWHLPQYRRRNGRRSLGGFIAEMAPATVFTLALTGCLVVASPAALTAAIPFLLLWMVAPVIAWWLSRPLPVTGPAISSAQVRLLRPLARRTWWYFETLVNAEENWLPPDNMQETPRREVASRTSPTNLGLALLANLAAWDLGYIATGTLLSRTRLALASMAQLERYQGHFYNWYDTRTMRPLPPTYVSSVDSGNLAGALVALRGGLEELCQAPVLTPQFRDGLSDVLALLDEASGATATTALPPARQAAGRRLKDAPTSPDQARAMLSALAEAGTSLVTAVSEHDHETQQWAGAFLRQVADHADDLAHLPPMTGGASVMPTLAALAEDGGGWPMAARIWAAERLREIERLVEQCRELETAMDFRFLYDKSRRLLSIGFDVAARRRDPGHYDLLASEARLASFLLIASEQAAPEHWFALGRLLTGHDGANTLASWSGSMFEYLMPALLMPHHPETLLGQTCRNVIAQQIRHARRRGIPWGISESCYNARDIRHVYQYRAFGVPGLGLQRGLASDLVVAPYATMLALPFAPREACDNLRRLIAHEAALGAYGLYEAVDYTPARIPRGQARAVVRAFMTHHQGMGLVAITNLLRNGTMIRRFMADPAVRATELLLQERIPQGVAPVLQPHTHDVKAASQPLAGDQGALMRVFTDPDTPTPEVHLLSNGSYHVMVTHAGGGYSSWRGLLVTRWREDTTGDALGTFVYLRDLDHPAHQWSAAFHPLRAKGAHYEAIFTQGRAEYRRRDHDLESHTEICVSPEEDVEIRRITLANLAPRKRRIETTSYAEVVLAPLNADRAHPAFCKLFVHTEILAERQAILCMRRPRAPSDPTPWVFHLVVAPGATLVPSFETDRASFLGRNRTPANPIALEAVPGVSPALGGGAGDVIDPIMAIRQPMTLAADGTASVNFITGVAATREAALALVDKYRDHHFAARAFDMAWSHSQIILRQLNVSEAQAQVYGRLAGSMLYAHARHRASPGVIAQNHLGQPGLWRLGLSGDLPIMLLRIGDLQRLERVHDVLLAHAYWRMKGLRTDLVIVNEDFSGYRATLNDRIIEAISSRGDTALLDQPGGIFVRRIENLSEEDRALLQTAAHVVLPDSAETLQEQVDRRVPPRRLPPPLRPPQPASPATTAAPLAKRELIFDNQLGGFTPDGREYVIRLEPAATTPAPWVNVIASPHLGTVVSESGSMYTWADNAHEFRITPWHNDPVADTSGEATYLRDEDSGRFWSLAPLPTPGATGYVCRHGFGYSVFEHDESGIFTETWIYVAMDAPVKFVVVKIRNHSGRPRRLSLTSFHELVLGEWRHPHAMHIVTERDPEFGAVFARNLYSRDFSGKVVFASCSETRRAVSGSRAEFLGRNRPLADPAAMHRTQLSNITGAGFDPGIAQQAHFKLADGQARDIVFTLGATDGTAAAHACLRRFAGPAGAREALAAVWEYWNRTLGAVNVETPDPGLNILVNGWLPYQTISCRLWGRSGHYQSGGAFGFRDQLQDAMAIIHTAPEMLREQLLRCAAHQFQEGDVQHWWHPPGNAGVRTRFSDDYLWLPFATARYVQATADTGVLDEPVPFLAGRPVNPGEDAYYETETHHAETATLYEHCARAVRLGLNFGTHGLPLIGCGDWNDGMNLVGVAGRGESVWLAWFLYDTLTRFGDVARSREDAALAETCRTEAEKLRPRLEESWDGAWYRRAYFDDGTPLGSAANDECQIDSISQSWAVLSGAAPPARARQAMQSVMERLVRQDDAMVLLFTPPFERTAMEPGYIKGYPPGMRENGGQYTHGAIWSAMAFAMLGEHDLAWRLFQMLSPIAHGDTARNIRRYRVEPYVMAADVYSVPPHRGRGGWTWYTGAAGWMYRLALETLLGLERHGDHLRLNPRLPAQGWERYCIHYRYRDTVHHLEVRREAATNPSPQQRVLVDNVEQPDGHIPLHDDRREHFVTVLWSAGLPGNE